ncbi:MAG: hypothetical protein MUD01_19765, partial [Chloroflexaceae bacterium]|nr:hypothetical protein [Chloroflexaceae bacterium]
MDAPDITLMLGPAASGKTSAALELLREPRRGRALLLVPGGVQLRWLNERVDLPPRTRIKQFYSFADTILRMAGKRPEPLTGTMGTLLLRRILRELAADGKLPLFARVAHKPGFVATVGQLLEEAQQNKVDPQRLASASVTPYDAELGLIYAAYESALTRLGRADINRRLALARDALRANPRLLASLALLVVDGFDQFTPLQQSLLHEASRQARRTVVTLTGADVERPAHRRFTRTRQLLTAEGAEDAERRQKDEQQRLAAKNAADVEVRSISASVASATSAVKNGALVFLESHLFSLDTPPAIDAAEAIHVVNAPDREREVRAALRRAVRLTEVGVTPEQIAIIYRDGTAYTPLLHEVANEYGLPLALHDGLPLDEAPAVVAWLNLLRLPLDDWPRRSLIEALRWIADDSLTGDGRPELTDGRRETGDGRRETGDGSRQTADHEPPTTGYRSLDNPKSKIQNPKLEVSNLQSLISSLAAAARAAGVVTGLERLRTALHSF